MRNESILELFNLHLFIIKTDYAIAIVSNFLIEEGLNFSPNSFLNLWISISNIAI